MIMLMAGAVDVFVAVSLAVAVTSIVLVLLKKCCYGMLEGYRGLQSSRQEYHLERFVGRLTLSLGEVAAAT